MATPMRLLIVIALSCLLSKPVLGQDFETGVEAHKRGDYAAALRNWQPLAEQGHAGAQYQLGVMYEYGRGVPPNDAEAVKWYTEAAGRGVAAAQYKLGIMYDNGWGVSGSDAEAVKWYRKAAVQGHAYAQYDLGLMFASGAGVPRDYVRAHMWLNLAIAQGNNHMIKHRNEIAKNMTPAQIADARRMAREWMQMQQEQSRHN
jgi:TPR repeat protein